MAIELRHLRYFVAVAEAGQLTVAAARLRVAQPALSQSIRGVEAEIGTALFERHPRGVTLTPAGEAFLTHARTAIAASDAAVSAARQTARITADQLVLGFLNGALTPAQPLLSAFAAAHPEIEVTVREVSFANQVQPLLDKTIDAAVLCPGPPNPELRAIPIATTSLAVFVSDDHHLACRTRLRFADVADETYIGQAPGLPEWWVDVWWLTAQRGRRPRTSRQTSGTVSESLAAILSGEVIVIAPAFFIPPYPMPGITTVPLIDVQAPDAELVYPRNHATSAAKLLATLVANLPQTAESKPD